MHYEIYEFIKRSAKQWILEWSVGYNLLGPLNPNCGGGVGLFIDKKYKDYEILSDESVFEPHLYESILVKIKMKSGRDKIIGNVYRHNTSHSNIWTKSGPVVRRYFLLQTILNSLKSCLMVYLISIWSFPLFFFEFWAKKIKIVLSGKL